ncbi:MAG TPA: enolase C-terminal domain-like protein [Thermoplasmata archaeon]|nr:enolase C-terminal domain-like protein [Thermoplasmata archaeon]
MSAIRSVDLGRIYDSRGRPTVEARVVADSGARGTAGAPSGESTGRHEVQAFPDGGVPVALDRFRELVRPRLVGAALDLGGVDALLHDIDGSPRFERIGGNVATAVSVAVALTVADERQCPLVDVLRRPGVEPDRYPAIVGNCMNGGRHAIGGPDIQEFIAFSPAPRPEDAIRAALAVHAEIGSALHARYPKAALGRGDEGGWVAPIPNVEALELLAAACAAVRDRLGVPVHPGVDVAASELYRDGRYRYREQTLDDAGQLGFLTDLTDRFGLRYIEDPFDEEAFGPTAELTRAVGGRAMVVGDDLYTTDVDRVRRGIAARSTNAVLIKVNQVGTVTDAARAVDEARSHGLATVTSHRSGELPEGWLAHAAVGFGSAGLKCGLLGGERVAKLNELLRLGGATGAPR